MLQRSEPTHELLNGSPRAAVPYLSALVRHVSAAWNSGAENGLR